MQKQFLHPDPQKKTYCMVKNFGRPLPVDDEGNIAWWEN
jgi:hypothetical protein